MKSTWKGLGALKFVTRLPILLFLNNRYIIFADAGGVKNFVILGGGHRWMTPKGNNESKCKQETE